MRNILAAMDALQSGYSEGWRDGRRRGVTLSASLDRRRWLYGVELGGRTASAATCVPSTAGAQRRGPAR